MDNEQRRHLEALQQAYQRRLHVLELKAAQYGLESPAHILTEMEDLRAKLAEIDIQFADVNKLSPHDLVPNSRHASDPNIDEYSLYLASWEHLYFLPDGVPAGLPNQLFSRHPWALILFENLYCDENGFIGEKNAAEEMNWTNSELFVQLASSKYDIIKTLDTKTPLQTYVNDIHRDFEEEHGISVATAIGNDDISIDELFKWRVNLIKPFLDENRLILYDWSSARQESTIPLALQMAVKDVLSLQVARVPLTKDITTELSNERKQVFDSLQEFEKEPLRLLRMGRLPQTEYLDILKQRIRDYREVDIEMVKDVTPHLERILRLRESFARRGGWDLVRDFLRAYYHAAHPRDLSDMERALKERLYDCFSSFLPEFGPANLNITQGDISLLPLMNKPDQILASENADTATMSSKDVRFFRGQSRRGKRNKK